MNLFIKTVILLVALIHPLSLPNSCEAEPTAVFVSILPLKFFVERIGGREVAVEVMVKPGESPATFNPNPKKMSRLANSTLYFSIGVPFERIWISRIQAIQPDLKIIPLNKNIPEPETTKNEHNENHGHSHEEGNPHIWTSPPLVKILAAEIESALSREKPEKADYFKANYQALALDLDKLDQEIRDIFAKGKNRTFMVFHPAWTHFAETYGLEQIAIEHQGKEPGARALQALIEKGKKLNIKVIFAQKQFSLSIAKKIAKMIGATVREMDPLAENYLENMRQTAIAISGANN